MSETETKLLAYVGRGLGSAPTTRLGVGREIQWNRHDKQVRAVPAERAKGIMRDSPGQFALVDTLADAAKRWSIPSERLAELADRGKLHGATFTRRGEAAQPVIVLDEITTAGIEAERKAAKKAAKKEKE